MILPLNPIQRGDGQLCLLLPRWDVPVAGYKTVSPLFAVLPFDIVSQSPVKFYYYHREPRLR